MNLLELIDHLKDVTTNISPQHWRIQAIRLQLESSSLVIINSYFPNDPSTANFDDASLNEVLEEIRAILSSQNCEYFLLLGDINADFTRRTGHVKAVSEFIESFNLKASWDIFKADFSHISDVNEECTVSPIDHYFWNDTVTDLVSECGILHLMENNSDHCPIYCKMVVDTVVKDVEDEFKRHGSKPSWKRASNEEKELFTSILTQDLNNVRLLDINCSNVHCRDLRHLDAADEYLNEIVNAIENACEIALPKPNRKESKDSNIHKKAIAGWNDEVESYQKNALFWFAVWSSAGKPLNCQLHCIMKRTRKTFHLILRKCRKSCDKVKSNKLLEACLNNSKT